MYKSTPGRKKSALPGASIHFLAAYTDYRYQTANIG